MNHCDFSAVALEHPKEVAVSEYRSTMVLPLAIPKLSEKKIDTKLDLILWSRDSKESALKVNPGDKIYVYGCKIRYNLDERKWRLER